MGELCRGWDGDAAWHGTVPLGLYEKAVHSVCGFLLSEDELCQLLCAVHPGQGEPPSGKFLREQPFDYNRLTHAVKVNAARSASAYIRSSSSPPRRRLPPRGGWGGAAGLGSSVHL